MLSLWPWLEATVAWFQAALGGMASPWVIALALALTTLLLEDVAIAAGVALAAQGTISWELSLLAVGAGIAAGDMGLYAAGRGARRVGWLHRRFVGNRTLAAREHLVRRLPSAVLLARVIPGLRLLTYTACGFVRIPWAPFLAWVVLAVAVWTVGLYALSAAIGQALVRHLGLPAPLAVALPVIVLALWVPVVRGLRQRARTAIAAEPPSVSVEHPRSASLPTTPGDPRP